MPGVPGIRFPEIAEIMNFECQELYLPELPGNRIFRIAASSFRNARSYTFPKCQELELPEMPGIIFPRNLKNRNLAKCQELCLSGMPGIIIARNARNYNHPKCQEL